MKCINRHGGGWRLLFIWALSMVLFPLPLAAQNDLAFTIERDFLDIENFVDWRSYQSPIDWRYDWYFTRNGMRTSVGSVSMYRFYNVHEIRLEKEIGRYFALLYEQEEDSFYSPQPIYREAEMRFGREYYVSIIGFPEHEKKLSHMGYTVSWGERRDRSYVRFGYLEKFFTFNDKNANTDINARDREFDRFPITWLLEGQHFWNDRLFVKLDYRRHDPGVLRIEAPFQIQRHGGENAELTVDWHTANQWLIGLTAQRKTERTVHEPDSPTTDIPDLEQDLILRWADLYLRLPFLGDDQLTVGLLDSLFQNRIDSSFVEQQYWCRLTTTQVYGFWEHVRSDWFSWMFSFQGGPAGLDKEFLDFDGEPSVEMLEMKAGVGIVMQEKEQYRFYINTTWDLDLFHTRQWDGGNVQLQFRF